MFLILNSGQILKLSYLSPCYTEYENEDNNIIYDYDISKIDSNLVTRKTIKR